MPAKPPRTGRRARRSLLLLASILVAAVLAIGHALLWHRTVDQLAKGFAAWTALRRAEGWGVAHGPPQHGGWPFAATLTVPEPHLNADSNLVPGGAAWHAEAVVLRISPTRPDRLILEMPGRHHLRIDGAVLSVMAESLHVALPLRADADPREAVAAEARRLRVDTPDGTAEIGSASLRIGESGDGAQPTTSLLLSVAGATLPPGLIGTARLGDTVERIALDLVLTSPPGPGRDAAQRAAAWREGGGTLEVRRLEARWGEAIASASATLTLDGALQPAGTGTVRLSGGDALLDAAGNAGLLSPLGAAAARVALRALSRAPPSGDGPPQAELPLMLRNRSLSLGGIPLARLPAWDWERWRWIAAPEPSRLRN
jgi:hypothetical protein